MLTDYGDLLCNTLNWLQKSECHWVLANDTCLANWVFTVLASHNLATTYWITTVFANYTLLSNCFTTTYRVATVLTYNTLLSNVLALTNWVLAVFTNHTFFGYVLALTYNTLLSLYRVLTVLAYNTFFSNVLTLANCFKFFDGNLFAVLANYFTFAWVGNKQCTTHWGRV